MTEEEAFEKVYTPRTSAMGTSLSSEQDRDLGFGDMVSRETRLRFFEPRRLV